MDLIFLAAFELLGGLLGQAVPTARASLPVWARIGGALVVAATALGLAAVVTAAVVVLAAILSGLSG